MVRIPTHRAPTHPGEMLLEEDLIPMGLTQRALAAAIRVPYQRVNDVINGRRRMTLQLRWDLYFAERDETEVLEQIRPYQPAAQGAG